MSERYVRIKVESAWNGSIANIACQGANLIRLRPVPWERNLIYICGKHEKAMAKLSRSRLCRAVNCALAKRVSKRPVINLVDRR